MKEQFDKRLVEKIKDSFEQFQEPLDPVELEKFRKLYLGKKNKGFFSLSGIWWGGIAASIIIGAFIVFQKDEIQNNLIDSSQELISSNEKNVTEGLIPADTANTSSGSLEQSNLESSGEVQEALDKEVQVRITSIEENTGIGKVTTPGNNLIEINSNALGDIARNNEIQLEKKERVYDPFITSIKEPSEVIVADESEQEAIDYIQNWLGDEKEINLSNTLVKVEGKKEPLKLGVLVAPQTISNTTQTLNLGAGIMSEFSFSRRIKLDVGLAYARQHIEPTSGGMINFSSADLSNSNFGLSLAEDARSAILSGNYINASNELSFGQLEIPINLKFKVLENKSSDLYVVSGFSNMLYLNQQNVTTFNAVNLSQPNFSSSNQVVETFTQTQRPDSGSGNVDSGQMLNLGVGFEQSLKNGTFISIEPFYKLSLGTQTFSNQQFSIGGVNLRMNFQIKNKKE